MANESPTPQDLIRNLGHDWDPERVEVARIETGEKIRARRRRRVALQAAGAVVAIAAAALLVFMAFGDSASTPSTPESIEFADGSTAMPLTGDSRVVVDEVGPRAVRLSVLEGGAVFDVEPSRTRPFRVVARDVMVEVLGTRFQVELLEDAVDVHVFEGRVRVVQQGRELILETGTMHRFGTPSDESNPTLTAENVPEQQAPLGEAVEPPLEVGSTGTDSPEASEPNPAPEPEVRTTARTWQQLTEAGDFDAAFARLGQSPPPVSVPHLLLAADAARFSGNANQAVRYLRMVRTQHSSDARAPLAAFTEGRILLLQLGRPGEAARAFGQARRLSPRSSLAEDALAREVEAYSRAGAPAQAEPLAREYLRRYPNGRRAAAVRHHAGLL